MYIISFFIVCTHFLLLWPGFLFIFHKKRQKKSVDVYYIVFHRLYTFSFIVAGFFVYIRNFICT